MFDQAEVADRLYTTYEVTNPTTIAGLPSAPWSSVSTSSVSVLSTQPVTQNSTIDSASLALVINMSQSRTTLVDAVQAENAQLRNNVTSGENRRNNSSTPYRRNRSRNSSL